MEHLVLLVMLAEFTKALYPLLKIVMESYEIVQISKLFLIPVVSLIFAINLPANHISTDPAYPCHFLRSVVLL